MKQGPIDYREEMESVVQHREMEKLEGEEMECEVRFDPLTSRGLIPHIKNV